MATANDLVATPLDTPNVLEAIRLLDKALPASFSAIDQSDAAIEDIKRASYMADQFIEKYMNISQTLSLMGQLHEAYRTNTGAMSAESIRLESEVHKIKTNTQKTRMRYMVKRSEAAYKRMVTSVLKVSLFLVGVAILAYAVLGDGNRAAAVVATAGCGVLLVGYVVYRFVDWYNRDRLDPKRIVIRAKKPTA